MKYIKEYNQYYYSTRDFSTDKKMISMRDSTIEYLDKLYDIIIDTAYVDSSGNLSSFTLVNSRISNNIRYLSIYDLDIINVYEYEDEWYEVEHMPDNGPSSIYWCDQLDGVIKCINKIYNK